MQGEVIDETIEALKAFGATEEQIAAEKNGINYKSLEYLCKIYTVKDSVAMFEGIQVMEYEALSIMQKDKK